MSQWSPPNQTPYSPPPGGYSYTPYRVSQPETPEQKETKRLRKDANYIGLMMLALTAGLKLFFTVVVLILCFAGLMEFNQLNHETLGLSNTVYLLLYGAVYSISMLIPPVLIALCFKRRQSPLKPHKPMSAGIGFFGVLGAMGVCMVANLVASMIATFFRQIGATTSPELPEMMDGTAISLLLNIFVLAVLPAILEELVFRGYVMQAMRPYGNWFAVWVSSLLFSLMHGNLEQIPFSFVVGLALGWLLIYTDNIWLCVAVHFCNNAMSVLMGYFGDQLSVTNKGIFNLLVIFAIGAIGGLSLLILFLSQRHMFSRLPRRSLLPSGKRWNVLLTSPAFFIALAVFVYFVIKGMNL